jgi:murein L,D-transpeptidase YafK
MANEQPWVLVDTQAGTLSVMQGDRPTLVFRDISIGRYGATLDKRQGDHKTPLGDFRIAWVREDSPFHRFIGLDYPNLDHARRAYRAGIGLHGVGEGDPKIHQDLNWTSGCIAVTNEQIDQLLSLVGKGTRVSIR